MMKCPYCGHESKNNPCDRCKALIPEKEKKQKTEAKVDEKETKE